MASLTEQEINLYRGIAELAYTIAIADNDLAESEQEAFYAVIKARLVEGEWEAESYFKELVTGNKNFDTEQSYQNALQLIRNNRELLTKELINKFNDIMNTVAQVQGVTSEETAIIERFEKDIEQIFIETNTDKSFRLSKEHNSLYSAIGQLAYIIAMADKVMMQQEKDVFHAVIREHLGDFDWVADDRFQLISDLSSTDLEGTYEHTMYLIRKNAHVLTEGLIKKFLNVMIKVAKVAGVTEEEQEIINRFKKDVYEAYQKK